MPLSRLFYLTRCRPFIPPRQLSFSTDRRRQNNSNNGNSSGDETTKRDGDDNIQPLDTPFGKFMRAMGIQIYVSAPTKSQQQANNEKQQNDNGDKEKDKRSPQPKLPNWVVLALSSACAFYFLSLSNSQLKSTFGPTETTIQELIESEPFKTRSIDRLIVSPDRTTVLVFIKSSPTPQYFFSIGSVKSFEQTLEAAQSLLDSTTAKDHGDHHDHHGPAKHRIPIVYKTPAPSFLSSAFDLFLTTLPFALILLFLRGSSNLSNLSNRSPLSNLFNIGKSRAKLYNTETSVKTTFKDVAGMDEAKEEVVEFVKFLKEPRLYEALGAKIPKGAILSGPPGTGKTLLAKAIAGEAGVPFLSVSGSEFVEMFVGVGSSRVRDLFVEAKKLSPCIVFIDEIDAIGRERKRSSIGGNDERESTLNQLLVEMDGFDTDHRVVVLAGTNRPDVLDPALTRPGRFDRHVSIDKPDVMGRKSIYLVHLGPIKLEPMLGREEIAVRLAYMTPGFAGADIANVCNEGALIAARWGAAYVTDKHLEAAVEKVVAGIEKKSRVLGEEERNIVAHHEAGHAAVGWFLKYADPIMKVTIIPRTSGALGFARTLPSDNYLMSREQLLDRICVTLGGRAAEEIFFGEITSGAQNDLMKVTKWAYEYVAVLGMDEEVGPLSFVGEEERGEKRYSEATAKMVDERVRKFVMQAYERTKEVLGKHKDQAKALAALLLEKETVHRDEIEKVLGVRPFPARHSYDTFIQKNK